MDNRRDYTDRRVAKTAIKLPPELWAKIKIHGYNQGVTMSQVVEVGMKMYFTQVEKGKGVG